MDKNKMTPERFVELCAEFREREEAIFGFKTGEYATDYDRMWNFHAAGQIEDRQPSEVALSYFLKHVLSIAKAVKTGSGAWAWETEAGEGLKQRISDARNYLLLIAGLLEEERLSAEQ